MENSNGVKVTLEGLDSCVEELESGSLKCKELLLKIIKGYEWIQPTRKIEADHKQTQKMLSNYKRKMA